MAYDINELLKAVYGGNEEWGDWMDGRRPITVGAVNPKVLLLCSRREDRAAIATFPLQHLNAPIAVKLYPLDCYPHAGVSMYPQVAPEYAR